ncbi:unnamed protein product [Brassica oleracea var. botrytis]
MFRPDVNEFPLPTISEQTRLVSYLRATASDVCNSSGQINGSVFNPIDSHFHDMSSKHCLVRRGRVVSV